MSKANTELFIMLSDRCNFSCHHCLTSSSPKANRYNLSEAEIQIIAEEVNNNTALTTVHFSGGEPSLFKDKIISIQSKIKRSVEYEITTNAWFSKKNPSFLDDLNLSSVTVSFDKYRTEFISTSDIELAFTHQKSLGRNTKLNFTYDSILDLALLNQISKAHIDEVRTIKVTKCGRQKDANRTFAKESLRGMTCPSLIEGRRKINYFPNDGYSVCCGPLLFDRLADPTVLYTQNTTQSPIEKNISGTDFYDQFKSLGLTPEDFNFTSPCEACTFLYEQKKSTKNESLYSFITGNEQVYTVITSSIPFSDLEKIEKNFDVSIITKGTLNYDDTKTDHLLDLDFVISDITNPEQAFDLTKIIGKRTLGHIPDNSRVNELTGFKSYFDRCILKKTISYKDQPCAILLVSEFKANPYDNTPSIHLGFYGYAQDHGHIISRELKSRLNRILETSFNAQVFTGLIAISNQASLKYFGRLGITPIGYRINKRSPT